MGLVLHTPHRWLSVGRMHPVGRAGAVGAQPQPRRARLWPLERPCSPACRQSLVGTAARLLAVAVNRCVVSGPRASHATSLAQHRPYAPSRPCWSTQSTATASACQSVAPCAAVLSHLPREPRWDGRSAAGCGCEVSGVNSGGSERGPNLYTCVPIRNDPPCSRGTALA